MDTDTVIVTNLTDDADFDFRKNSSSVRTWKSLFNVKMFQILA